MTLPDLQAIAQRFADRADADVDAAFNAQHDLDRQQAAAVESIQAAGRERHRRDEIARAAAAAAVNGTGDSARFGPLDDDEYELPAAAAPRESRTRPARVPVTDRDIDDDIEDEEQTWLR